MGTFFPTDQQLLKSQGSAVTHSLIIPNSLIHSPTGIYSSPDHSVHCCWEGGKKTPFAISSSWPITLLLLDFFFLPGCPRMLKKIQWDFFFFFFTPLTAQCFCWQKWTWAWKFVQCGNGVGGGITENVKGNSGFRVWDFGDSALGETKGE